MNPLACGECLEERSVEPLSARNVTTTAEGVETEPPRVVLRVLGCTEMQGHLFGAAKPAADIWKPLFPSRERAAAAA